MCPNCGSYGKRKIVSNLYECTECGEKFKSLGEEVVEVKPEPVKVEFGFLMN